MKRNKTVRNDILLICAVALAVTAAMLLWRALRAEGGSAVVYVDGREYISCPLDSDARVTVPGAGGGFNVLVIRGGEAYISEADCPNRICVKHRPVKYAGQTITCLPHRVTVVIESARGGGTDVDAG